MVQSASVTTTRVVRIRTTTCGRVAYVAGADTASANVLVEELDVTVLALHKAADGQ